MKEILKVPFQQKEELYKLVFFFVKYFLRFWKVFFEWNFALLELSSLEWQGEFNNQQKDKV